VGAAKATIEVTLQTAKVAKNVIDLRIQFLPSIYFPPVYKPNIKMACTD
jgi:hypothetical protein